MKVCVAQVRPTDGDISCNVISHARLVVFPELSITGYERAVSHDLAVDQYDGRFDVFQSISDSRHVTIGIGAPTRNRDGVCISLLLFQPHQARQSYSKMHLHSGEEEYFVPGPPVTALIGGDSKVALAICHEVSVPEHAANAFQNGAGVYLTSVANTVGGIERGLASLSQIAREYSMIVLMSNCISRTESWAWAGRTSVWKNQGVLLSQLNDAHEGIIVVDADTQEVMQRTIEETVATP